MNSKTAYALLIKKHAVKILLLAVCLCSFSAAKFIYQLQIFENTPGQSGITPETLPSAYYTANTRDQPVLMMFVHPKCSCTRASTAELVNILTKSDIKPQTKLFLYTPDQNNISWLETDNINDIKNIPGVEIVSDINGKSAEIFGAKTSGHTLLYNSAGELVFSGGITSKRGQIGNSEGKRIILENLNGNKQHNKHTSVFGCEI